MFGYPVSLFRRRFAEPFNFNELLGLASRNAGRFVPVLVFGGTFAVYLRTLAPTVYALDSAEYVAAAYNLGVPHPTGYPLYLLLGKLFTFLPVGDVAYRMNLMSAFFASGTVLVVYQLSYLLSRRVLISASVAGYLAFSFYFWASAVAAEVYSLHAFLTACTIYLLVYWHRGGGNRLLYLAGALWGLSFGNHMTTALLGPAFAFFVVEGLYRRRVGVRQMALLAACFLLPLAIYIYIPIRYFAEVHPYALGGYNSDGVFIRTDTSTIRGMWIVLTAQQFEPFFFVHRGLDLVYQLGQVTYWLAANFLGVGLTLGLLGIVQNYLVDRRRLIFLGLIFVPSVVFFASYGSLDRPFMFLIGYLVWAVWMLDGLYLLQNHLERFGESRWLGRVTARMKLRIPVERFTAVSLLLPVVALMINFSYADLSSFTIIKDRYPNILNSFEANSLVVAWWPDSAPMYYFQQVERLRTDVQVVDRYLISAEDEANLIARSYDQRPVYVFGTRLWALPQQYVGVPTIFGGTEVGYRLVLAQPGIVSSSSSGPK